MKYIVTFHFSNNYGAYLQAFALSSYLSASCINFIPDYHFLVGSKVKRKHPFLWRFLALLRSLKYDKRKFNEFYKLPKTLQKNIESLKTDFRNGSVFITGSDQVWNPNFISEREDVYFLKFPPPSAKRISYAASLGMDHWPKEFERRVLPMLQKFDAISVREESSVSYLTSLGLKNVVCVCDPTILHKVDFYRKEFPYERRKTDYTFIYRIRESIPLSVKTLLSGKIREVNLNDKKTIISVTEWLQNIDNSKYVITDSFHCVVFCILFHKPFLILSNQSFYKGMNERFATLLGRIHLEYRLLTCQETPAELLGKLNKLIDWDTIDSILDEWRSHSIEWLNNALEK